MGDITLSLGVKSVRDMRFYMMLHDLVDSPQWRGGSSHKFYDFATHESVDAFLDRLATIMDTIAPPYSPLPFTRAAAALQNYNAAREEWHAMGEKSYLYTVKPVGGIIVPIATEKGEELDEA